MRRTVSCSLTADLLAPARLELQVAVAAPASLLREELSVTVDGVAQAVEELTSDTGGRLHVLHAGPGLLEVGYRADVDGRTGPPPVQALDAVTYLRPSRYCESDRLGGWAAREFGAVTAPTEVLSAVTSWVATRLSYELSSSRGTDSAVDTLLAGEGVCRDFAHLAVALLRAREVPARLVAAYAPGLSPMDFHAVVEALVDGVWRVADPTGLAPRQSLLRIATGRDAADTAFLAHYGGEVTLRTV
nr:transglutaminase family protein [Actinomycetota bacterium]